MDIRVVRHVVGQKEPPKACFDPLFSVDYCRFCAKKGFFKESRKKCEKGLDKGGKV
jgi:hypothetical protein